MGGMKIGSSHLPKSSLVPPPPTSPPPAIGQTQQSALPRSSKVPPPPKTPPPSAIQSISGVTQTTRLTAPSHKAPPIPAPTYKAPPPPGVDLSTPELRAKELSAISHPETYKRTETELLALSKSKPTQEVDNAMNLMSSMKDPAFGKILEKFSPSMGQRFLQAFGKSEGSVDGGRFKKTIGKMLPLINIGLYGKDAFRAQHTKKALNGIAEHAAAHQNPLAQQLAEALGAHEKSKRNTQIIGGAVSVLTSAVAFVPGTQAAPALAGASQALASGIGVNAAGLAVNYTAAAAVDSGIKTVGGTLLSTGASYAQDYAVTAVDRQGSSVSKEKIGSGYGKLKVSVRKDAEGHKVETEMGYQAARALVNYLGPAQGADEAPDSARMQLRKSLGALDNSKSYHVSADKKLHRDLVQHMNPHDASKTDFLQMFFDIGVKGAGTVFN